VFLTPKGADCAACREQQSNWRSIKGSRGHRAQIGIDYHRAAAIPSASVANHQSETFYQISLALWFDKATFTLDLRHL
jgi:hypothetical protein